uniref:Uncharacterized protein n=1 Tax=viral metagenome TaxID=1070528 RepID=A0A6M3LVL0_9ZZZZ
MTARVVRFDRARAVADYVENGNVMTGCEIGGLILSPMVLESLAVAKMSSQPCEFVVTGEEWAHDGRHFLTFGVQAAFVEATTDYRHEDHAAPLPGMTRGSLHYVCPECTMRRGHHARGCSRKTP